MDNCVYSTSRAVARSVLAVCAVIGSLQGCSREAKDPLLVQAYVMSACPHSSESLSALIPVVTSMQGRVALNVEYVAKEADGKLSSILGANDLQTNKWQLCAQEHAPAAAWLGFMACQARYGAGAVEHTRPCAEAAQISVDAVEQCMASGRGEQLLRQSAQRSRQQGVTNTPTLLVAGRPYQRARTKELLMRTLCDALDAEKPKACVDLPQANAVSVTIVSDQSCKSSACRPDNFISYLDYSLPSAQVLQLDVQSSSGKQVLARLGQAAPVALFGPTLAKEADVFATLKLAGLIELPDAAGFVLPLTLPQHSAL